MDFRSLIAAYSGAGTGIHSVAVARGTTLEFEWYASPRRRHVPHMLHSATKSFVGTAVGLAVGEGMMRLTDTLASFLESDLRDDQRRVAERITVADLLTMRTGHARGSSGVDWRRLDGSWVQAYLAEPQVGEAGTEFIYSSGSSHMLSVCVHRATGESVRDYLEPRLFRPLGFTGYDWSTDPDGHSSGGNGLRLRTVDLLKWGVLYLRGGQWRGEQIVDPSWVEASVSPQVASAGTAWTGSGYARRDRDDPDDVGYGYQIWTKDGAFYASGMFGQMCVVVPSLDLALAMNSALPREQVNGLVDDVLTTLHADSGAGGDSGEPCEGRRSVELTSLDTLGAFVGEFAADGADLLVRVDGGGAGPLLRVRGRDEAGPFDYLAGIEGPWESWTTLYSPLLHHSYSDPEMLVSATATVVSDSELVITVNHLMAPFTDTLTVSRAGPDRLRLTHGTNVNSGPTALDPVELHRRR